MSRTKIEEFDLKFAQLHAALCKFALRAGDHRISLSLGDPKHTIQQKTVGSCLIRSAAAVEQMINGITVRLWDDPFEWTLPERMPRVRNLIEYLDEVEAARIRGFRFLISDDDLQRSIPAPVEIRTLEDILSTTLLLATRRASEVEAILSDT